jgi:diaminopropionate ammonia-lyase
VTADVTRFLYNPAAGRVRAGGTPTAGVLEFHRSLPGYEPTPLREWPELASELGVRRVHVKDESRRLGLPSFKILGASWAVACALAQRVPGLFAGEPRFDALLRPLPDLTLLAATDGNHGRAVARIAAMLGLRARILVPSNLGPEPRRAIAAEGAEVEVVDGSYDDAVRQSAAEADERRLLISDTSWPGYEDTPGRVIAGYSTILRELDRQLPGPPGLVVAQIGVGAFAAAVARHYRGHAFDPAPRMIGVEPVHAACMLASVAAGRPVEIPGPHDSIMAGLNCGVPSTLAWPVLRRGLDVLVAVEDEAARDGMRRFAAAGIVAGECGAAAPAGLLALLLGPDAGYHRRRLAVDAETDVLLFVTEGAGADAS